jgi:ligand-binding SRPBCC domain-containing protein
VASRGTTPTLNVGAHSITWERPSDTFWKDYEVNVVSTSNGNRAVTLDRVATKLKLTVTDEVKAECAEVAVEPVAWYYGLDYVNGAPLSQQQTERVVAVPANLVGTSGQLAVTIFGLSGSTEWTTDVTVSARTAEHAVIGTATMADVPFKANRATEYSGPLFGTAGSMTLTLGAEWDTSATGTW